jgi:hypothetical protein
MGGKGGIFSDEKIWDMYFRGHANFFALFRDMVQKYNLGSHPAGEHIVFGGHSSGARGALTLIDRVEEAIKSFKPDVNEIKVLGFMDSPFLRVDVENIDGSENEYERLVKKAKDNEIFSASELKTECKNNMDDYKCFIADYLLDYV